MIFIVHVLFSQFLHHLVQHKFWNFDWNFLANFVKICPKFFSPSFLAGVLFATILQTHCTSRIPAKIVEILLNYTYIEVRCKQKDFAFSQNTKNLLLPGCSITENVSKFTEQNTYSLKTFKTLYQ